MAGVRLGLPSPVSPGGVSKHRGWPLNNCIIFLLSRLLPDVSHTVQVCDSTSLALSDVCCRYDVLKHTPANR
jgi:hypothetical protein